MIAQRFRSIGWVAGVAAAATALYLVSLQVAVERSRLEAVEAQINDAQGAMRRLRTELGTRGSMRQLEQWNAEVLRLSVPKESQFVSGVAQLTALNLDHVGGSPNDPPPIMVADSAPTPEKPAPEKPATAPVRIADASLARLTSARLASVRVAPPAIQPVSARITTPLRTTRLAMIDSPLARDLASAVAAERRIRP